METKEFLKVLGDKIWKIIKDNGKGYAVSILANYLNVPIQYDPTRSTAQAFDSILSWPRNSSEAAIDALLRNGKDLWSDSSKMKAANDIYKTAKSCDDSTRTYAIKAIHELQNQMWNDYNKRELNKLITALAVERKDA